ncbi:Elongation of fatty acids protein 2 [Chytridiales sp. JEL 0842]|nr:Elongation of fatty acids protein 2 [Chytridiales sp. JEL 0842]
MGVRNLTKLLERYAPNCLETIPSLYPRFTNCSIAVDTLVYARKFLHGAGDDHPFKVIAKMHRMINLLLNHNIRPVFVFDNRIPQLAKCREAERRAKVAMKNDREWALEKTRLSMMERLEYALQQRPAGSPEALSDTDGFQMNTISNNINLPSMNVAELLETEKEWKEKWSELKLKLIFDKSQQDSVSDTTTPNDNLEEDEKPKAVDQNKEDWDTGEVPVAATEISVVVDVSDKTRESDNPQCDTFEFALPTTVERFSTTLKIDYSEDASEATVENVDTILSSISLSNFDIDVDTLPEKSDILPADQHQLAQKALESMKEIHADMHREALRLKVAKSRLELYEDIDTLFDQLLLSEETASGNATHENVRATEETDVSPQETAPQVSLTQHLFEEARNLSSEVITKSRRHNESLTLRTLKLTTNMVDDIRELLKLMGIPCITSPHEGEAMCAFLSTKGVTSASATEDMDCCIFGDGLVLRHLTYASGSPLLVIDPVKAREELNLTREQFVDLAILCGTDFSSTLKGIGHNRALQLIQTHGSIESILATGKYVADENFDYRTARSVYLNDFDSDGSILKTAIQQISEVEAGDHKELRIFLDIRGIDMDRNSGLHLSDPFF